MRIGFDYRMGGSMNAGIGRYSFELLLAMLKQKERRDMFYVFYNKNNSGQKDLRRLEEAGAELVPVGIAHYSVAEQIKFPAILEKYQLDLMHFPNFNVPIRYRGKFVVTIHDMLHHKLSGKNWKRRIYFEAYKYIINHAAKYSERILTVTNAAKSDIVETLQVPEDKVTVIYEAPSAPESTAFDVEGVKKKYYLSRPYILFVGTLERRKNLVTLAKGFEVFMKNFGYDMDLVISGKTDAFYPEIRQHILEAAGDYSNRIVFTGYVSDRDQISLYRGAYAFITASMHEGFGLPGLEAMQFGVPVLAANTAVFNEVYDNGAIYFDGNDPEDIADKIHLIVKDAKFYAQFQEKSESRHLQFSWETTARETLKVYRQVAGTGLESQEFKDAIGTLNREPNSDAETSPNGLQNNNAVGNDPAPILPEPEDETDQPIGLLSPEDEEPEENSK